MIGQWCFYDQLAHAKNSVYQALTGADPGILKGGGGGGGGGPAEFYSRVASKRRRG